MNVTFHGAAREVTGSMHLLENGDDRVLFDCGLFQGKRKESNERNRKLPFDPGSVTNAILSHAHIDHSGRTPVLTRSGSRGRVLCTRATADACRYLLRDSAHIQESDARYLNYKAVRSFLYNSSQSERKGKITNREVRKVTQLLKKSRNEIDAEAIVRVMKRYHLKGVVPLYTKTDAEEALGFLDGRPYGNRANVGKNMTCTFYDAGHILGSAVSIVTHRGKDKTTRVCYTGDLGRFDKPIIEDPTLDFAPEDRDIDLLIVESTYGNRLHDPVKNLKERLRTVLNETYERGGSIMIPSFAFGRTQELLYFLHELYNEGGVPLYPVYVDSPLAINLTTVFGEHPEVYDRETHKTFLNKGKNPFSFPQITFVNSRDDSIALMRRTTPSIVIAGSGMCEAGRILHHLRNKMHNPLHTILIVGFMARNTLGRRLADSGRAYADSGRAGPPPQLKVLGKEYPLAAHVVEMGGFSAHADKEELFRFVKGSNLRIAKIAVVHGEEEQSLAFAARLKKEGYDVVAPKMGETVPV